MYGGRRLGKSALLCAAARRFEQVSTQKAIYVDLSAAGIRTTKRPEAIWDLVANKLIEAGIAERRDSKRKAPSPAELATVAIQAWLAGVEQRRLLLLLDECDDFFDLDAASGFAQTRGLKDLMESTGRRFKVVFAGLHQVQRFASVPNQPLSHLGKSTPIGPLAAQYAYNLIAKPFDALGWRFAHEDLVNRVLAYCNYTPILLQEFGHSLIEALHNRPLSNDEPPQVVTKADIEAVLSSGTLADAIRSRFDLTLSLDPRYKVIAYVLALESAGTASGSVPTAELRHQCRDWWADGFSLVNDDEFRALLEELVGLGVLAGDGSSAWRLRSSNVLRLLGARSEIEDRLEGLIVENPVPGGFSASDARRVIGAGTRSPLTEQQLAEVIGEGRNQLRVIVGTEATGVARVAEAIDAVRNVTRRFELVTPTSPATFEKAVFDVAERTHRVVVDDLTSVARVVGDLSSAARDNFVRSLKATNRLPARPGATRSVVLVVSPAQLPTVETVLDARDHPYEVMALRRYTLSALRSWAVDMEGGFDDGARRRLLELTGGWPALVEEIAAQAGPVGVGRALDALAQQLPARAVEIVGLVGLDTAELRSAWATVVAIAADESQEREVIADFLAEDGGDGPSLVRALAAAGLLAEQIDGGVRAEPIAVEAWRRSLVTAVPGG